MKCANPLDAAALFDYWVGKLDEPEVEAVEEHLFACDPCGERLKEAIALAEGVRRLAMAGELQTVVSEAFVKRAQDEGLRVRQYAVAAGDSVQCTVAAEDDFLIGRMEADLRGLGRVDLSLCDAQGAEMARMEDIPFDGEAGSVLWQYSITRAKAAPSETLVARLVAVEGDGERVIGEYTFHHTRTLPGPGAW
ncbi:MAG: zf-HC2 domain-containing protein [Bryobacteraceae bacterium]